MSDDPTKDDDAADGGNRKPKPPRVVVELPKKRELSERHLEHLATSGLTAETAQLAEFYTEINARAMAVILNRKAFPRMCGNGLVMPFYVPGAAEPYGYRIRPSVPRIVRRGTKEVRVKYEQPDGTDVMLYYTPRGRAGGWYSDVARTLFWTEGEKKALALDQLELACVGLTGVWNWGDTRHKESTGGEERLHPLITDHVAIVGRHHVICFDADAHDNEQVMLAARRLCGHLLAAGAASIKFVTPPSKTHKGIDDYFAAFGDVATRALLDSPGDIEPADPRSPLQLARKVRALRDAPINDQLRLPEGYEIQKDGTLWKLGDEKHGDVKIARSAILIKRYLDDYYTHEARVDICYERDGVWLALCVGRKTLIDARTMVADAGSYGAPVTSNSAPKLVDWLEDLERVNAGRIERVACVARAGWHTIDGERVFVLDRPIFQDENKELPLALDTRGDRKKMFGALEPRGDADKHLDALRRGFAADPICAAVICGALAAPLLDPLGAPNFAIHLPGDSSRGKTSMLKVGASIYGDPASDTWVASWNTTAVGAELRAATLTDLPQCYDEVGSSDVATIERMVYMLVNGGGRARGKQDLSLRETPTWRTIVISTGERELADESTATGAQIRVIQLPVVKFGNLMAAEIDALREACAANAGSFGRQWIETLLGIDDWAHVRELYRTATKKLRAHTSDPLQGRIAAYFAVLCVAEMLAAQLGLGEASGATMIKLFADIGSREAVRPLAERAFDLVQGWVMSEAEAFPELELGGGGHDEAKKNAGKTRHGFRKEGLLIFIPNSLRSYCDEHRLSVREVVREWKLRGWLQHEPTRLTKVVRVGSTTLHYYVLDTGAVQP
jgi:hypothetical protein